MAACLLVVSGEIEIEVGTLRERVHALVGSAGGVQGCLLLAELEDGFFQRRLDASFTRSFGGVRGLSLPAEEGSSVVGDGQEVALQGFVKRAWMSSGRFFKLAIEDGKQREEGESDERADHFGGEDSFGGEVVAGGEDIVQAGAGEGVDEGTGGDTEQGCEKEDSQGYAKDGGGDVDEKERKDGNEAEKQHVADDILLEAFFELFDLVTGAFHEEVSEGGACGEEDGSCSDRCGEDDSDASPEHSEEEAACEGHDQREGQRAGCDQNIDCEVGGVDDEEVVVDPAVEFCLVVFQGIEGEEIEMSCRAQDEEGDEDGEQDGEGKVSFPSRFFGGFFGGGGIGHEEKTFKD